MRQNVFANGRGMLSSEGALRGMRRFARSVVDSLPMVTTVGSIRRAEVRRKQEVQRMRDRYLSLMVSCLTGTIYDDPPMQVLGQQTFDSTLREYGWDWPSKAHTMIGIKRLSNLRTLLEDVLARNIPGDLIETGVWRGGACILMQAMLHAYGIDDRRIWIADSFQGLPPPDAVNYPADEHDKFHTYRELVVEMEEVQQNFKKYGLLDDKLVFLKGWFKDTLPTARIDRLAILRLDGDMYESTILALDSLYDKLSEGGYVIIDDYHVVKSCKLAVDEFITRRQSACKLEEIDGVGVYWKKPCAGI